jgi:hypothetical protein
MNIDQVRETTRVAPRPNPFQSSLTTVAVCVLTALTFWGVVLGVVLLWLLR